MFVVSVHSMEQQLLCVMIVCGVGVPAATSPVLKSGGDVEFVE